VRRARRAILILLVLGVGGAVISTAIAEYIGWSGRVKCEASPQHRFVAIGGKVVWAEDFKGAGWRCLSWTVTDRDSAAAAQYEYDKPVKFYSGHLDSSYLHPDAPETLPRWAHLWDPADWPPEQKEYVYVPLFTAADMGVGWPLPAFTIYWDTSGRNEWRGGTMLATPRGSGLRFWVWRPIARGLLLDSLFWAAALLVPVGTARSLIKLRRRRRGACTACGYDLRGLADGALCPECGAAGRVASAPA
jgi:hypothetical protein